MASNEPNAAGGAIPVTTVSTADLGSPQAATGAAASPDALYPAGAPEPSGATAAEEGRVAAGQTTDPSTGTGVDGEIVIWEGRYSKRNFIGQIALRSIATAGWLALAFNTWGMGHENRANWTWLAGILLAIWWVVLFFQMMRTHYAHYYRLTNRRLFVSTGIVQRRRDMLELLRIKDVFTRQQSLMDRWIGLGSVVVVPDAKDMPTYYLLGVNDPKQVMDLIWHQSRSERDDKSVMVDSV